jgi:pyridoxamine 5'-phosphate oxidase
VLKQGGHYFDAMSEQEWLSPFEAWLAEARATEGPWSDALTLATATAEGVPAARAVMMRGLDERGVVFFSDEGSRKGHELADNPRAAAVFLWPGARRQVRLDGRVTRLSDAEADAIFATRPAETSLPVWAWRQDDVVADRDELVRRLEQTRAQRGGADVPRPDYWVGYRLEPDVVEFWAERPAGLHERLRHERAGQQWRVHRLAP